MTPWARRLPLAGCLLWAATCRPAPTPPEPAPEVLVAGCADWDADHRCIAEGALTVWVQSSTATVPRVQAEGFRVGEPVRARGGHRFTLTPTSSTAPPLSAALRVGGAARAGLVRSPPRPSPRRSDFAHLTDEALLELLPDLGVGARIDLISRTYDRMAPEFGPARSRLLQQGATLATALSSSHRLLVLLALEANNLTQAGDLLTASDVIEHRMSHGPFHGLGAIWRSYARARLARQRGDDDGALRHLFKMESTAARLGDEYNRRVAMQVALPLLRRTGYWRRAETLEQELLQEAQHLGCFERIGILTNVGWSRLMERQALQSQAPMMPRPTPLTPDETTDLLLEARRAYERCGRTETNSALNLALDALQRYDSDRAAGWLRMTSASNEDVHLQPWRKILLARLARLQGDSAAGSRILSALLNHVALEPRLRLEASTELGLALVSLGDSTAAQAQFQQVEDALDLRPQPPTPAGEGDAGSGRALLASHGLVDLLASTGRVAEAFEAARRAQRRAGAATALRPDFERLSLEDRVRRDRNLQRYYDHRSRAARRRTDLWVAPSDAAAGLAREVEDDERAAAEALFAALLGAPRRPARHPAPTPPSGRLVIALYPGVGRWWALAQDQHAYWAVSETATEERLEAQLERVLERLPVDLRSYRELRLLPSGAAQDVDLHAALYRGGPIGLAVPVSYGFDGAGPPRPATGDAVVLLGDEQTHLASRRELTEVQTHLRQTGRSTWRPEPERLDRTALAALLSQAQVLHFAGHAERSEEALRTGLRLRDDLWLTAADVLASPSVPEAVVLSGCDTSRHGLRDAGLSMADAFLAAGAQRVVGTQRAVEGQLALRMMRAFYAARGSIIRRLHEAGRQVQVEDSASDWAAFRVMAPADSFDHDL